MEQPNFTAGAELRVTLTKEEREGDPIPGRKAHRYSEAEDQKVSDVPKTHHIGDPRTVVIVPRNVDIEPAREFRPRKLRGHRCQDYVLG